MKLGIILLLALLFGAGMYAGSKIRERYEPIAHALEYSV